MKNIEKHQFKATHSARTPEVKLLNVYQDGFEELGYRRRYIARIKIVQPVQYVPTKF